ncbi:hypothetical protein TraAM80_05291 [Trypanosoma rangeli]|uniref:Uncharacterized protein n=1 Tax=Trypanosoma rangeli TaxID=5698 RepID=A0A422NFG3_TRYRA|nr:uncharacterized protein TraAM80_05291 [Trypanosoma rangeli]RNF04186.1 hypothetical protein TraAM80_05291 [Trypanosoma rangeli]|eukprot:RNF04186.1 hypothetical protein TraAM80_05291 [Trypanosoma rangeli]
MGFTVFVSAIGSQPEVTADVQYNSPLLLCPWTKNEVLLAIMWTLECSLRDPCGSRRRASWIHRYVTSTKLHLPFMATGLARWSWLKRWLRRLMSLAEMTLFARMSCALLIALELELVESEGGWSVLPRGTGAQCCCWTSSTSRARRRRGGGREGRRITQTDMKVGCAASMSVSRLRLQRRLWKLFSMSSRRV